MPHIEVSELIKSAQKLGLENEEAKKWVEAQQIKEEERRQQDAQRVKEQKELELEIAKLRKEEEEIKKQNLEKEQELLRDRGTASGDISNASITSNTSPHIQAKMPSLPFFNPEQDKIEQFLNRFERYFSAMQFPAEKKAVILSSYLKGSSLECYHRLAEDKCDDYVELKSALLARYNVTSDTCREDFHSIKMKENETFIELKHRTEANLTRWLKAEERQESFEDLYEMMVINQMMRCFPPELRTHIKEQGITTAHNLAIRAERYRVAHKTTQRVDSKRRPNTNQENFQRNTNQNGNNSQRQYEHKPKTHYEAKPKPNNTFKPVPSTPFCRTCNQPHDYKTCTHAQKRIKENRERNGRV